MQLCNLLDLTFSSRSRYLILHAMDRVWPFNFHCSIIIHSLGKSFVLIGWMCNLIAQDDCSAALILQSQDGSPEALWHCFSGAVSIKAGNRVSSHHTDWSILSFQESRHGSHQGVQNYFCSTINTWSKFPSRKLLRYDPVSAINPLPLFPLTLQYTVNRKSSSGERIDSLEQILLPLLSFCWLERLKSWQDFK